LDGYASEAFSYAANATYLVGVRRTVPYDLRFRNGVSRYAVSLIINCLLRPEMVLLT